MKKFENQSASEKRVSIAKDVLKQILQEKIIVQRGDYIDFTFNKPCGVDTRLLESIKKAESCTVCAIGATLISLLNKSGSDIPRNKVDLYQPKYSSKEVKKHLSVFGPKQLYMIEYAFEGRGQTSVAKHFYGYKAVGLPSSTFEKLAKYLVTYASDRERLVAIMQNIIENKGTFNP